MAFDKTRWIRERFRHPDKKGWFVQLECRVAQKWISMGAGTPATLYDSGIAEIAATEIDPRGVEHSALGDQVHEFFRRLGVRWQGPGMFDMSRNAM